MVRLYFTVRFLQTIVPPLISAIGYILSLTGVALTIVWTSINNASTVIADHWVDEAVRRGLATIYTPQLYYCVRVLAFFMMLVAWLLAAHLTVFITWLVF